MRFCLTISRLNNTPGCNQESPKDVKKLIDEYATAPFLHYIFVTFGQVYVALSRARRLDGLQIIGLAASNVRADATVSRFYEYRKKGLPYTPTLWMDS